MSHARVERICQRSEVRGFSGRGGRLTELPLHALGWRQGLLPHLRPGKDSLHQHVAIWLQVGELHCGSPLYLPDRLRVRQILSQVL